MQFNALFHVSDSIYLQVVEDGYVLVKLKTGKDPIHKIILHYGDPFYGVKVENQGWVWQKQQVPMTFLGEGQYSLYWGQKVKPKFKRIRYYFEIFLKDGSRYFYGEKGIRNDDSVHQDNFFGFTYPYVHKEDGFNPAPWLASTLWYQIFPERFANGDLSNDPKGTQPWGQSLPTGKSFYGGDLRGIIEKLDYIASLGFTGLYLTPIFESPSNHKYDTIDYLKIDPSFGTKEDLKELVDKAHKKGIRVILDAVFNHASVQFQPFQDVLKNQEQSRYKDWFQIKRFPIDYTFTHDHTDLPYETFAFAANMPKLNTSNLELEQYLVKVATYWIKECDIDGWRLDVANEQPHTFWRTLRKEVLKVKKDAILLGESWSNSAPWLTGDQFDSIMNYRYTNLINDYVVNNVLSNEEFVLQYIDQYNEYTEEQQKYMFNLLDSHDTKRVVSACHNHIGKIFVAYALLFTHPGSPCVYYGGENGMEGKDDPDNRRCMNWDESTWNLEIRSYLQKLIQLRKDYASIFIDGSVQIQEEANGIHIIRTLKEQSLHLYFNFEQVNIEAVGEMLLKEKNILITKMKGDFYVNEA